MGAAMGYSTECCSGGGLVATEGNIKIKTRRRRARTCDSQSDSGDDWANEKDTVGSLDFMLDATCLASARTRELLPSPDWQTDSVEEPLLESLSCGARTHPLGHSIFVLMAPRTKKYIGFTFEGRWARIVEEPGPSYGMPLIFVPVPEAPHQYIFLNAELGEGRWIGAVKEGQETLLHARCESRDEAAPLEFVDAGSGRYRLLDRGADTWVCLAEDGFRLCISSTDPLDALLVSLVPGKHEDLARWASSVR